MIIEEDEEFKLLKFIWIWLKDWNFHPRKAVLCYFLLSVGRATVSHQICTFLIVVNRDKMDYHCFVKNPCALEKFSKCENLSNDQFLTQSLENKKLSVPNRKVSTISVS